MILTFDRPVLSHSCSVFIGFLNFPIFILWNLLSCSGRISWPRAQGLGRLGCPLLPCPPALAASPRSRLPRDHVLALIPPRLLGGPGLPSFARRHRPAREGVGPAPCAPPPHSPSRSSPSLAEPHCPPSGVSWVSWPLRPVGDPRLAWPRVCPGQRAPLRWPGSKAPPLGHLQGSDLRESSVPSQAGSLRAVSDARVRLGAPVLRSCPSGVSPFPAIPQVSGHSSCPSFALSPGVCPGTAPRFQPAAPPPRAASDVGS